MPKTPSYRKRKGYDQALVTLTDSVTKRRRDYWLGPFGSAESRELYHRLIAEWEAAGRQHPDPPHAPHARSESAGPTVTVLIADYWCWAKGYYSANEASALRVALRVLRAYYGELPAADFGPKKLRALREAMVAGPNVETAHGRPMRAWSRVYVNQQVQRIRRMFRWAASQEMVPASVHDALQAVEGLKRGRTRAHDGEPVMPVPVEVVNAARPFMPTPVRAMVDLQLLTGARPGELTPLRGRDIDRSGEVWIYRPKQHKTSHRGRHRTIYFGPKAQAILAPLLKGRDDAKPLFSPAEADAERRARRRADRVTPLGCGNGPGTNRRAEPRKAPGEQYTVGTYRQAVAYACDRAFPPPPPLGPEDGESAAAWRKRIRKEGRADELKAWRRERRFHPHQLRHTAATLIRAEYGLEHARILLGHSSGVVTEAHYAERDEKRLIRMAAEAC